MSEFMTDSEEMAHLLARIKEGCEEYGRLTQERQRVFEQLCAQKRTLLEIMERVGLKKLEAEDGTTCRARTVRRCRTVRSDPAAVKEVFSWLEENAPEMIDRTPRLPAWQTEQKFWLARREDGEPIPDCVKYVEEPDLQFGGGAKFPREYQ